MNCPICGQLVAARYRPYEIIGPGHEKYHLERCPSCGIVYTAPQPRPEQLQAIYDDPGYYAYLPFLIPDESSTGGIMPRIRRWMKTAIIDHYYGYGRQRPGFMPHFALRAIGRLLKPLAREDVIRKSRVVPFGDGGRHLDLGCGSGGYVWWMVKHGWRSEGIDLNTTAVRHAQDRQLAVRQAALPDTGFPADSFDLVTAWGVIEHLANLPRCLAEIARITKRGGRFIGFVPNIDSWDAALFRENWQGLEIPAHLYHFTPVSLHGVLAKSGFRMIKTEFMSVIDCWKASLDKLGITSEWRRGLMEIVGRAITMTANRSGKGAMFRFESVRT